MKFELRTVEVEIEVEGWPPKVTLRELTLGDLLEARDEDPDVQNLRLLGLSIVPPIDIEGVPMRSMPAFEVLIAAMKKLNQPDGADPTP